MKWFFFSCIVIHVNASLYSENGDFSLLYWKPLSLLSGAIPSPRTRARKSPYIEHILKTLVSATGEIQKPEFIEALKGSVSASESLATTANKVVTGLTQVKNSRQLRADEINSSESDDIPPKVQSSVSPVEEAPFVPVEQDPLYSNLPAIGEVLSEIDRVSGLSAKVKRILDELTEFARNLSSNVKGYVRGLQETDNSKPELENLLIPGISNRAITGLKSLNPIGFFKIFYKNLYGTVKTFPIKFDTTYDEEAISEIQKQEPIIADLSIVLQQFVAQTEALLFTLSNGVSDPFQPIAKNIAETITIIGKDPFEPESWENLKNSLIDLKQLYQRLPLGFKLLPRLTSSVDQSLQILLEEIDFLSTEPQITKDVISNLEKNFNQLGVLLEKFDKVHLRPILRISGISLNRLYSGSLTILPKFDLSPILNLLTSGFGFSAIVPKLEKLVPIQIASDKNSNQPPVTTTISNYNDLLQKVLAPAIYEQTGAFVDYFDALQTTFSEAVSELTAGNVGNLTELSAYSDEVAIIKSIQLGSVSSLAKLLHSLSISLLPEGYVQKDLSKLQPGFADFDASNRNHLLQLITKPPKLVSLIDLPFTKKKDNVKDTSFEQSISDKLFNIGFFIRTLGSSIHDLKIDCSLTHLQEEDRVTLSVLRALALVGSPLELLKNKNATAEVIEEVLNVKEKVERTDYNKSANRCDELNLLLSILNKWAFDAEKFGQKLTEAASYELPRNINAGAADLRDTLCTPSDY